MTKSREAVTMPLDPKEVLKELREKHGFSLKELAQKLQISMRTLYRIQKGERVSSVVIADMVALYCKFAL